MALSPLKAKKLIRVSCAIQNQGSVSLFSAHTEHASLTTLAFHKVVQYRVLGVARIINHILSQLFQGVCCQ